MASSTDDISGNTVLGALGVFCNPFEYEIDQDEEFRTLEASTFSSTDILKKDQLKQNGKQKGGTSASKQSQATYFNSDPEIQDENERSNTSGFNFTQSQSTRDQPSDNANFSETQIVCTSHLSAGKEDGSSLLLENKELHQALAEERRARQAVEDKLEVLTKCLDAMPVSVEADLTEVKDSSHHRSRQRSETERELSETKTETDSESESETETETETEIQCPKCAAAAATAANTAALGTINTINTGTAQQEVDQISADMIRRLEATFQDLSLQNSREVNESFQHHPVAQQLSEAIASSVQSAEYAVEYVVGKSGARGFSSALTAALTPPLLLALQEYFVDSSPRSAPPSSHPEPVTDTIHLPFPPHRPGSADSKQSHLQDRLSFERKRRKRAEEKLREANLALARSEESRQEATQRWLSGIRTPSQHDTQDLDRIDRRSDCGESSHPISRVSLDQFDSVSQIHHVERKSYESTVRIRKVTNISKVLLTRMLDQIGDWNFEVDAGTGAMIMLLALLYHFIFGLF